MTPDFAHHPPRVIGYLRVSTEEQANSGAGLAAQRAALEAEADRRGWEVEFLEDAGVSAKDMKRPALTEALARLDAHKADVLMVTKVDRLSRSLGDFTRVLERAERRRWSVVCLDLGVDTSSPTGELLANIVASTAQYERRLIGQRTKDALAAKKAAGVRLGRPQTLPAEVVQRVVTERDAGRSWQAIADGLTADALPTARGGAAWTFSSTRAVYNSQAANGLRVAPDLSQGELC
ncbi:recombinase family protein [Kineococcus glutinatus]|uniref:Resolvase/invertase-type recombinase catalytic domain-containing protein n=1 Tax=Kineococcus glutinatus TaxID=1070872 RepID=A0ABP9HIF6_9ACTN